MHARLTPAFIGLLLSTQAALAVCDLPTLAPIVMHAASQADGRSMHVVTGVVGICDAATRSFEVELPDLRGIQGATAQLSLAGFSRKYGVHQISFILQSVRASPTRTGIVVQYGAAVDGLDRYQLAYTLYISTSR